MNRNKIFTFLFILILGLFYGCNKEKLVYREDAFEEEIEKLDQLNLEVTALGQDFIEINWSKVKSSHFNEIEFKLYLDDQLITTVDKVSPYSFIRLAPAKDYRIKVVANSKSGLSIGNEISIKTLGSDISLIDYQEYQIHSQSRFTGAFFSSYQLSDGGYIITRFLQHDNFYSYDTFKIITFRTNSKGEIIWYRLMTTLEEGVSVDGSTSFTLVNEETQEANILIGGYAFKLELHSGTLLNRKDLRAEIAEQSSFSSARLNSDGDIIAGVTSGELYLIDFDALEVRWKAVNSTRGSVVSLRTDKAGNIYYIFVKTDYAIRVHKRDPKGNFIAEFLFDGKLPNERSDYGFWMDLLLIDNTDHLYLFGRNNSFSYYRYFKFDSSGKLLLKNEKSSPFVPQGGFFDKNNDLIVYGRIDGYLTDFKSWIYKYNAETMNIKESIHYTNLSSRHYFFHIGVNPDNSYGIFFTNNSKFAYIKTLPDGKLP